MLTYFATAFLSGLIPAMFWSWFWLREDTEHPEPLFAIIVSFISGMLVVPVALYMQKFTLEIYSGDKIFIVWVIIEEILKYIATLLVFLWNKNIDEPIDMIIYIILIALGFAALENSLFVFNQIKSGAYADTFVTGSFRFLGSTLLHVLASGTIGVAMALTYYKTKIVQLLSSLLGLFIAVVLHALFNFFIMKGSEDIVMLVFLFVWIGIIFMFIFFEKVKIIERKHNL